MQETHADPGERVLTLHMALYHYDYPEVGPMIGQVMHPFYFDAADTTGAEARAREICEEEERISGRVVFFEEIEQYPHGFTTGARNYPGRIRVDTDGNRIVPKQQRPFPQPPNSPSSSGPS